MSDAAMCIISTITSETEHDCIIRLETERNTYKKLYEDIMNRRR